MRIRSIFSTLMFARISIACAVALLLGALPAYAQLTPSGDAYTNTSSPGSNFGAKPLLDVQSASQNTYIQFDLSPLPAGMTGSSIAKATLKLYVNTVATAGSFNVDLVNGTWDEKSITANLAPALGATVAASVPLTSSNAKDYIVIDVTSAMQAWLNGTANDGLALVGNSPLNATFDSKESTTQSHPPELDVMFAAGTGTISGINTASGSGLRGGGTSGTLNLSLLNTCGNKQVLQWNGSSWGCATISGSGTVTSVGLSAPSSDFTVTGSPITTSGTLGLNWTVAPTSANTANAIVKRDNSGSLSANNITATGTITSTALSVSNPSRFVFGVQGEVTDPSSVTVGVAGITDSPQNSSVGVSGVAASLDPNAGWVYGVHGMAYSPKGIGVFGTGNELSLQGNALLGNRTGVWGDGGPGNYGVVATTDNNDAVLAVNNAFVPTLYVANNASSASWVLWAIGSIGFCRSDSQGDLACTGTVTGGAHADKFDHPLDPANKYLVHSGVESPDLKTVYDGVIALTANGEASVQLPDYVESLNGQFRYQLTAIGAPGPNLYVAQEISKNQFRIAGGTPGMKVSWQVTGIRQDAWSKAHPTVVEEEKTADERGYYLHPEAFGQPREKGLVTLPPAKQHPGGQTQTASTSD